MSSRTGLASMRGTNCDPIELGIVLIGGRRLIKPSGKSSVGNIILGRDVFDTNTRTVRSVMRREEVSGRQVTVVDTPAWMLYQPLALTPKLTQLEIQKSAYLCPPGPNAFVLVMPLEFTHVGTGLSAEEHVSFLLSDQVWRQTIVVFTVVDKNKMMSVSDIVKSDFDISYLIKKCEERFHVLNITDREDGSQVTELLDKIELMVYSNVCHFELKKHVSDELIKMERTIRRRAKQRMAAAQEQSTRLPERIGPTDLRILILGRYYSGKSSAGNTILGDSVFKVGQGRSVHCEVRHGIVERRRLTVVDSLGWVYNSPLQDTSAMDKLEIQSSVSHCLPGPHAVLLTVPLHKAFTRAHKISVEQHMTLLTERVWSHSLVLFTCGDWLGDMSIEEHIEAEGDDLRWLVDKCGNRYHVFNYEKDDTQVRSELLKKIEEIVAENRGGHYEVDGDVYEKISERKRNIEDDVQTFMTRTHRQRTVLRAIFEGEHQSLADVRVMLVGGERSGRSAAGNVIVQKTMFRETLWKEFKTQNKLTECVRQQSRVAGRNVTVVDSPDWSTTPPSQKIKDILLHGVTLCSPGPHAVLVTVSIRSSFSDADRRSVEEHMELLGDRVWRYVLVLFTWGYWLGDRRVEEHIESEGEPLRWLLDKCGYRYHVLDFIKWDISEVTELMEKIEDMVTRNRGHFDFGPSGSRDDESIRGTGHVSVGHETRQTTLFQRLGGRQTFTAEQWNSLEEEWSRREEEWRRREEVMIERLLKSALMEPEETTVPGVRRRRSIDRYPPSMSDGMPSETGSSYCRSPAKVSDWLLKRHPGRLAPSSGHGTMSQASSQTETDTATHSQSTHV